MEQAVARMRPVASMPASRRAAMAGAIVSISSRPTVPLSPACGFRPATARRGEARPKSSRSADAVTRPAATIASTVSAAGTAESGICTVTGTTRSIGPASIITGTPPPARSLSHIVCPVWPMPASSSVVLASGFVTTAAAAPDRASDTARSTERTIAGACAGSGRPGTTAAARRSGSTGSARGKTDAASAIESTARTSTPKPGRAASPARWSGSAMTAKGCPPRSAAQAESVISGPIPAGSPIVSARGASLMCGGRYRRGGEGRASSVARGGRHARARSILRPSPVSAARGSRHVGCRGSARRCRPAR